VYTAPGAPVYAAPATPDELQQGMAATM
jgi:hypothetical protein